MFWWILTIVVVIFIWKKLTRTEINQDGNIYTSSIARGADPTTPEKLIIDEKYLTWKKNLGASHLWLSVKSVVVPRDKISGVIIIDKVIGTDIIIVGMGGANIRANCFSKNDANEIRTLLTP